MKQNLFVFMQIGYRDHIKNIILTFILLTSIPICSSALSQSIVSTIQLGPEAGNGFGATTVVVNHKTNMVYIANRFSSNISVVNGFSNDVIATIDVCSISPSGGIAVNSRTNLIYVIDECDSLVLVINGSINEVITTIRVEGKPRRIALNPRTNRVYVITDSGFFSDSKLQVIDGLKNVVIETIEIDDIPKWIDVNPKTNKIYIAISDPFPETGSLVVIDGVNNEKINDLDLSFRPNMIAINQRTNQIFVADNTSSNIKVVSGVENRIISTINIDEVLVFEIGLDVDSRSNKLLVTTYNGSGELDTGKLIIIDVENNEVTDVVNVGSKPVGIDVSSRTKRIYVVDNLNHSLAVIDRSFNVIKTVSLGVEPVRMAINSDTNLAYVTIVNEDAVYVIDVSDNKVVNSIKVGNRPAGICVNEATNRIYVANNADNSVNIIDGLSNNIIDTVKLSSPPSEIAVNMITNQIYVTTFEMPDFISNIYVIDGVTNEMIDIIEMSSGMPTDKIAINHETNKIYVSTSNAFGQKLTCFPIEVLDGFDNSIVDIVKIDGEARGITVNPVTNFVYAALSDEIVVIDGEVNGIKKTINIDRFVREVNINPETNRLYVPVSNGNILNIMVIDGVTNDFLTIIKNGLESVVDIDINPSSNFVYALDSLLGKITVIHDLAKPILLVADFTADRTFGSEVPFTVQFKDLSVGAIENWHWDFGDGEESNVQNPVHEYTAREIFTVTLAVDGSDGFSTEIKEDFIFVAPSPTPFPILPTPLTEIPEQLIIMEATPTPNPIETPQFPGAELCP